MHKLLDNVPENRVCAKSNLVNTLRVCVKSKSGQYLTLRGNRKHMQLKPGDCDRKLDNLSAPVPVTVSIVRVRAGRARKANIKQVFARLTVCVIILLVVIPPTLLLGLFPKSFPLTSWMDI